MKYLSPSGISRYRKDPEDYYLHYIASVRAAQEMQTQPMSIGSAFDAYAKSYIHRALFGKDTDPKYSFTALFDAQVDPHWRDWARLHGMYVFDQYQKSGALADLMLELQQAVNVPKFEIEVMGAISDRREGVIGVVESNDIHLTNNPLILLGKPDAFFINKHGAHCILDWKVNGYLSKQGVSPMKGYVRLRQDKKKSGHHPDCQLTMKHGVLINNHHKLEELNTDWATQLSIYSWLLGVEVGEDFIAGIDQICCAPSGTEFPDIRIAEHRLTVSRKFQIEVFDLANHIWDCVHSDHFFRNMTLEESQSRCQLLEGQVKALENEDPMFLEMTRSKPRPY